jgi:hypothetical protein
MASNPPTNSPATAPKDPRYRLRVILGAIASVFVGLVWLLFLTVVTMIVNDHALDSRPPGVPAPVPRCEIGTVREPRPWPLSGPTRRHIDEALREEMQTSTRMAQAIAWGVPRGLDLVVEFSLSADGTPNKVTLTSPRQVAAGDKVAIEAALRGCRFSERLGGRDATWMASSQSLEFFRTGRPQFYRSIDLTPGQLRWPMPRE